MRYVYFPLIGLCFLYCAKTSALDAIISVPEYNRNTPPQYATYSMGGRGLRWGGGVGWGHKECTITILSSPPKGEDGPTYVFELNGGNKNNCFGINISSCGSGEQCQTTKLWDVLQNVRVPYLTSRPKGYLTYQCFGGLSTAYYQSWDQYGWMNDVGNKCNTVPAEISCVVSVPTVIEHKPTHAGVIRSSARGIANIRCTGRASVGLSSPGVIALYSEKEKVDSRLSVQRDGATAVIVVADPSIDVDLHSDINTTQPRAGLYSGSGVLVASWD